jgi:hypothetical protein
MTTSTKKTNQLLKITRGLFNTTSFRANQYKQVVQKKIDLGSINKKIEQFHAELGKAVDGQYHAGQKNLLASKEVAQLLGKIASLKQAAILLEEEIELIRNESAQQSKTSEKKDEPTDNND